MAFCMTDSRRELRDHLDIKGDPPSKNRVWGFRASATHHAWQNAPQPVETASETSVTVTTTVSGILYWLSEDPIGEQGGINLYGYCENDPVNNVDPLGLELIAPGLWRVEKGETLSGIYSKLVKQNVIDPEAWSRESFYTSVEEMMPGLDRDRIFVGQRLSFASEPYLKIGESFFSRRDIRKRMNLLSVLQRNDLRMLSMLIEGSSELRWWRWGVNTTSWATTLGLGGGAVKGGVKAGTVGAVKLTEQTLIQGGKRALHGAVIDASRKAGIKVVTKEALHTAIRAEMRKVAIEQAAQKGIEATVVFGSKEAASQLAAGKEGDLDFIDMGSGLMVLDAFGGGGLSQDMLDALIRKLSDRYAERSREIAILRQKFNARK